MANQVTLSQIIEKRQQNNLPVDPEAIAQVRDNYLQARRSGETDVFLVDDTVEGEDTGYVVAPIPTQDGELDWVPTDTGAVRETLLNDFVAGLTLGAIKPGNYQEPSWEGDPLGQMTRLGGELLSLGKAIGPLAGRMGGGTLARSAAGGTVGAGYGGASAAMAGGDVGDVAKSAATTGGLFAALPLLHALPLPNAVASRPALARTVDAVNEGLLWGGLEYAANPEGGLAPALAAAVGGPLAARALRFPLSTRYEPLVDAPAQGRPAPPRLLEAQAATGSRARPLQTVAEQAAAERAAFLRRADARSRAKERPVLTPQERKAWGVREDPRQRVFDEPVIVDQGGNAVAPGQASEPASYTGLTRMGGKDRAVSGSADRGDLLGLTGTGSSPTGQSMTEADLIGTAPRAEPTDAEAVQSGQGESVAAKAEWRIEGAVDNAVTLAGDLVRGGASPEVAGEAAVRFLDQAIPAVRERAAAEDAFRKQFWNEPGDPVKPATKDFTLGAGLGGGQGVNFRQSLARPQQLPAKTPVPGSTWSDGVATFLNTGDPNAAFGKLRRWADRPEPPKDFFAELAEIPGLDSKHALWADNRTGVIQALAGGKVAGPVVENILRPMEEADMVEWRLADDAAMEFDRYVAKKYKVKKNEWEAVGKLAKMIPSSEVRDPLSKTLERAEIADLLSGHKPASKKRLIGAAKSTRVWLDRRRKIANTLMDGVGANARIENLPNYWPKREKTRGVRSFLTNPEHGSFDRPSSGEFFGTPSRKRTGRDYPLEDDTRLLLDVYNREIAQHVANNLAIKAVEPASAAIRAEAKRVAEQAQRTEDADLLARSEKLGNAADAVDEILALGYRGKMDPITKSVDNAAASFPVLRPFLNLGVSAASAMSSAHLGGLGWSLSTQWTSNAFVEARTSPQARALAVEQGRDPEVREWARGVSYAMQNKMRRSGMATAQDQGAFERQIAPKTAMNAMRDIVSKPGTILERELDMYSWLAGFNEAMLRGKTPQEAIRWGDDMVKKSQLLYDKKNRSLPLQSKYTSLAAKYQTFQVGSFNILREAGVYSDHGAAPAALGRTGAGNDWFSEGGAKGLSEKIPGTPKGDPKSWSRFNRAWFVAKLMAIAFLHNQVTQELAGKENWSPWSFLPYTGAFGGAKGKYGDLPTIAGQVRMFLDGAEKFIDDGDISDLGAWAFRNFFPAGADIQRKTRGALALDRGWVRVGNNQYVPLDADTVPEKLKVFIFGPNADKNVREHWERRGFR